jgi:cell division septation protein DedD
VKKPVVAQQKYRPATPPKRSPALQHPPGPPEPKKRPVVAKKPQPVATPKPLPVVKEPVKPVMPTQGKKISANGELFPEEIIRSYPYSVYLGSYQTRERAEKAIFEFQRKGLSPYWVEVYLGEKGVWYRVFNGYYKNREEAEAFIKRKGLEDGKAKRTKYATLIGIFATERDAQQNFVSLSRLGYHPYVIDQANGESMLFVGAFLTKKGAERLHKELESKGVHSRVVER